MSNRFKTLAAKIRKQTNPKCSSKNKRARVDFDEEFQPFEAQNNSFTPPAVFRDVGFDTKKQALVVPASSQDPLEDSPSSSEDEEDPMTSNEHQYASASPLLQKKKRDKCILAGYELIAKTLLKIDTRKAKRENQRFERKMAFLKEMHSTKQPIRYQCEMCRKSVGCTGLESNGLPEPYDQPSYSVVMIDNKSNEEGLQFEDKLVKTEEDSSYE